MISTVTLALPAKGLYCNRRNLTGVMLSSAKDLVFETVTQPPIWKEIEHTGRKIISMS
jgi:hypothetical protein